MTETQGDIAGEFITRSPEETFELARGIGKRLTGRTVLFLSGDLGAGKTVFAKGLASGLGVDPEDVRSPSFTLINIHEGRLRLYHIDLYRRGAGPHYDLGLDEILQENDAVVVIEWAERLTAPISNAIKISITVTGDQERGIRIRRETQ